MTRASLRWILDQAEITCAIPGFKSVKQVEDNLQSIQVPSYSEEERTKLSEFYQKETHQHIRGAY